MKENRESNHGNENSGYIVAVAIALLIAAIFFGINYATLAPTQRGFMSLYVLDTNGKAMEYLNPVKTNENIPIVAVLENHNASAYDCQIMVKTTSERTPDFPVPNPDTVETFTAKVQDGATWNSTATTRWDTPGTYSVVVELWTSPDKNAQAYQFSGIFCLLKVEVTT